VPDIAVGDGDQFDMMPQFGPLSGSATAFVFRIVRMGTEADDPKLGFFRDEKLAAR
jgi:hypothetical protein